MKEKIKLTITPKGRTHINLFRAILGNINVVRGSEITEKEEIVKLLNKVYDLDLSKRVINCCGHKIVFDS